MTPTKSHQALFLDRDGVLVKNIAGLAAKSPDQLELVPGCIAMLRNAKSKGYLLIVISNQPDEALGKISTETRLSIESTFIELLTNKGIKLDGIYYCYHHPDSKNPSLSNVCECRKPAPGLLYNASKDLNIDLNNSYFLGDRATDIKAGKCAKTKTILYDPDQTQGPYMKIHNVNPDFKLTNLEQVAEVLPDLVI